MKVLVVIGGASGVINHTLALSNLLYQDSGHEIVWLTGHDSEQHLLMVGNPYPIYFTDTHNLRFNVDNPGKVPHFVHSCSYDYLDKCVAYEVQFIREFKPDVVITKHHYSATISARVCGIPYVYYYTDGGEYIFSNRNPHNRWINNEITEDYVKVAAKFGLNIVRAQHATQYLVSPYMNIIRGIPLLSSLTNEEISMVEADKYKFSGILTYDGDQSRFKDYMSDLPQDKKLLYVTFGTHIYPRSQLETVIDALRNFDGTVLIATGYVDPDSLTDVPGNFIITKYAPNEMYMNSASLVIHHAGHGTTLTAFKCGVPQLVIPNNPNYSAQMSHVGVIKKHGCGEFISYQDLNTDNVKALINKILTTDDYKSSAIHIKEEISIQDALYKREFISAFNKIIESYIRL